MKPPAFTPAVKKDAPRLAIVVSHPIQYYSPWFRWLTTHTPLQLHVFYLWDAGQNARPDAGFGQSVAWDTDLLSGYASTFVPNCARHPSTEHFTGLHNPELRARLAAFAPDAVLIYGYAYRSHLELILRGVPGSGRVPLIFRGDSHLLADTPTRGLKGLALRALYARFAAVLPVGMANAAYFTHHGVPANRQFFTPHAVDSHHFQRTPERLAEASRTREQLGIPPDAFVFLFAGKFNAKKRPDLLLHAFLEAAIPGAHLVFCGDGKQGAALHQAALKHDHVHCLPFANQSAMPGRYLLGDAFVLPSEGRYETWGLAINEAMHMGIPCIVSDLVGCQQDLVTDGETGWVFPHGDASHLQAKLVEAFTVLTRNRAPIQAAIARRIAGYTFAQATDGLQTALSTVLATAP